MRFHGTAILFIMFCAPATAMADPGQNQAGKAFMQAFRANDLEAIAALYAEDAVYYPMDTLAVRGAKEIRASFAKFLGAFTVKEARTWDVQHETRGDLSVAWGKWGATIVPKAGGEPIKFEGRFSDVSKSVNGRWIYIFDHASLPAQLAGSAAGKRARAARK